jgi:hypothetical protein
MHFLVMHLAERCRQLRIVVTACGVVILDTQNT